MYVVLRDTMVRIWYLVYVAQRLALHMMEDLFQLEPMERLVSVSSRSTRVYQVL